MLRDETSIEKQNREKAEVKWRSLQTNNVHTFC